MGAKNKKITQDIGVSIAVAENITFDDTENTVSNIKLHKMVKGAEEIKKFLKNKNVINR